MMRLQTRNRLGHPLTATAAALAASPPPPPSPDPTLRRLLTLGATPPSPLPPPPPPPDDLRGFHRRCEPLPFDYRGRCSSSKPLMDDTDSITIAAMVVGLILCCSSGLFAAWRIACFG